MKRFGTLVMTIILAGGTAALARQVPPKLPNESADVEFPARWIEMLNDAYADIHKSHADISCFNVRMRKEGRTYRVSFLPLDGVEVDGDRVSIPVVPGQGSCGRGMYYEFNEDGALSRRTGTR